MVTLYNVPLISNKIENENRERVKETTTRSKSKQQPKATHASSIQRETSTSGGMLQLPLNLINVDKRTKCSCS